MSLFQRAIGVSGDKIAIHLVQAVISEISNGRLTKEQAEAVLSLSESEKLELTRFLVELSTCIDKIATSARVFNYLYLGEIGEKSFHDYTDEALFWQMLEAE